MKKVVVLAFVLVVLLAMASVAAAEDSPACDGLRRALERIPPDSPAHARISELVREMCSYATGEFVPTGSLNIERHSQIALPLADGRVIVIGGTSGGWGGQGLASTELYDPDTEAWQIGPSMNYPRQRHTATYLQDGRILVTGGSMNGSTGISSVEALDSEQQGWTVTAPLSVPRSMHTAVLLEDGRVVAVGGWTGSQSLASVEIYDPAANQWSPAGSLLEARYGHSATLLSDGRILIVGGYRNSWLGTAELYDPVTGSSTPANPASCHGTLHQATVLLDGRVLVVGGACGSGRPGIVAHAEIFDPQTNAWQVTAPMGQVRHGMTATLLPNGKVWVTGGGDGEAIAPTEVYDPVATSWSISAPLNAACVRHTATLLPSWQLLVAGGRAGNLTLNSVELNQ
jgi:hypothetical protein